MTKNRRLEKTSEMINFLKSEYELVDDLSDFEDKEMFLEATNWHGF